MFVVIDHLWYGIKYVFLGNVMHIAIKIYVVVQHILSSISKIQFNRQLMKPRNQSFQSCIQPVQASRIYFKTSKINGI